MLSQVDNKAPPPPPPPQRQQGLTPQPSKVKEKAAPDVSGGSSVFQFGFLRHQPGRSRVPNQSLPIKASLTAVESVRMRDY